MEGLSLLTGTAIDTNMQLVGTRVETQNSEIVRPELRLFDAQKQTLTFNEQVIKAKNAPKLSAFATGGYGDQGLTFWQRASKPISSGAYNCKFRSRIGTPKVRGWKLGS